MIFWRMVFSLQTILVTTDNVQLYCMDQKNKNAPIFLKIYILNAHRIK